MHKNIWLFLISGIIVICLSRLKVSEWAGPIELGWNKDLLELLKKFKPADCTITTKYYEIGTEFGPRTFEGLDGFRKWLRDVEKKPVENDIPLKVISYLFV